MIDHSVRREVVVVVEIADFSMLETEKWIDAKILLGKRGGAAVHRGATRKLGAP